MAIKKLRPTTPGQRFRIAPTFTEISEITPEQLKTGEKKKSGTRIQPEKSLLVSKNKSGGRNNQGRRTMRHIGGGHKQSIRLIDFQRRHFDVPATVKTVEYDPTRTARIALIWYADGAKAYILAPEGLVVGQTVISGAAVAPELGNTLPLKSIPLGTIVHNIELKPGKGGAMARSAGSYAQLTAREGKYATVKLPSGETRQVLVECLATVGTVSNGTHMNENLGKAGRKRWLGRRPRVRGVAMNPVDHPMGGGEGRASGGHPRSRNGQISKGKKTRSPKKYSNDLIISKKKKK